MHGYRVLLIRSDNLAWDELRRRLDVISPGALVGDTACAATALELAHRRQPTVVIASNTIENQPSIGLLTKLRELLGQDSRFILIVAEYDLETLLTYTPVGLSAFLLWHDLSTDTVDACLRLILTGKIIMGSQRPTTDFLQALQHRTCPLTQLEPLTPRESRVLKQMAAGANLEDIAEAEARSKYTIRRDIDAVSQKLDAPDRFTLGMVATLLGLIP